MLKRHWKNEKREMPCVALSDEVKTRVHTAYIHTVHTMVGVGGVFTFSDYFFSP